jgi:S-formylglutathione hydrolase
MRKIKIPIFIRILFLFALPLLACGLFQRTTPTPIYTAHPPRTYTSTKSSQTSGAATATPISKTQAARRTALFLTRAATATSTASIGPSRTPRQTSTSSPTLTPTPEFPRTDYANITAPALANNLLGELPEHDLLIYLPASYTETKKHYPVVYYLLDFGLRVRDVTLPPESIKKDVDFGLTKETILVIVSGANSLGGSFYVNSPITGNWDDYVAQDVVRYVDEHYRSISSPASRGISGYVTGGFGALSVAMRHPDVFGAVYSISPTLFDDNGLAASPMFSVQRTIDAMLDLKARELPLSVTEGISDMQHTKDDIRFSLAYGTTFAPNPGKPPYMDYPYYRQNGRVFRDEDIWKRWDTGFGALPEKVQLYKANLRKLNSITLACGDHPPYLWILPGCKYFSAQLTAAGITHQSVGFPGGLEPDLEQGIRAFILPFFSEKLTFEQ